MKKSGSNYFFIFLVQYSLEIVDQEFNLLQEYFSRKSLTICYEGGWAGLAHLQFVADVERTISIFIFMPLSATNRISFYGSL